MRSQKVYVPVRLLNDTICLNCPDLVVEDKVLQLCADNQVFYQHNLSCENVNRCERISNDLEKMIKERIKNVENGSGENNSNNGSELPEI